MGMVSAPLLRAESVGAPLPRMESTNSPSQDTRMSADELERSEPVHLPIPSLPMVWASQANSPDTPRPPPSFQALQAEDEARQSVKAVEANASAAHALIEPETEDQPNPRVVRGLQAMGFDAQLCAEAALCTGNESVEKGARWLIEMLDEHELARKAGTEEQPQEKCRRSVKKPLSPLPATVAAADSIGFVDKLTAALSYGRPKVPVAARSDEADEDEWEVVSTNVQQ